MRILRTGKWTALGWLVCLLLLTSVSGIARAEPYLAIQNGYTCSNCHVNPTGGGMRTTFGDIFAQTLLPAYAAPSGSPVWTGQLLQQVLRLGGDVRTDFARTSTPHSSTVQQFSLEQARVYTDISIIPDRLGVYVDQLIAPGTQNMEAYVRYGNPANWYLKAGHFYLPFGWRLQDQSAFVREVTGINMNTPDTGAEFGLKRGRLEWQIDASNGAANQASTGQNSGGGSGYMATTQLIYTHTSWRLGLAGSHTQSKVAGDRDMGGLFAGLRTGPVAWLGEADVVRQAGYADGAHTLLPMIGEMDWLVHKGNNLKLTYEFYDPNTHVGHDQQTRWSIVDEFTPLPFLQIRAGFRRGQGIPQNNAQNRTLAFIEAHGFF